MQALEASGLSQLLDCNAGHVNKSPLDRIKPISNNFYNLIHTYTPQFSIDPSTPPVPTPSLSQPTPPSTPKPRTPSPTMSNAGRQPPRDRAQTRQAASKDPAKVTKTTLPIPIVDPDDQPTSLREQLTNAYEAKVAETRSTRDPRLLKGKTINYQKLTLYNLSLIHI